MKCDRCHQNTASVHLSEIHDGKKTEQHLCHSCAAEHAGLAGQDFSLEGLLSGLAVAPVGNRVKKLLCSGCGMSFEDFQRTGKVGCETCYQDFREQLVGLLKKIQGQKTTQGKQSGRPAGSEDIDPLALLKKQLNAAVAEENYELAAQLRDHIRAMGKEKNVPVFGGKSAGHVKEKKNAAG